MRAGVFLTYECELEYYNEGSSAWTLSCIAKLATSSKHLESCPPPGLLALVKGYYVFIRLIPNATLAQCLFRYLTQR